MEGEGDKIFIPKPRLSSEIQCLDFFLRASVSLSLTLSMCCLKSFPLGELVDSVVQVIYNLAVCPVQLLTEEHTVSSYFVCGTTRSGST